MQAEFDLASVLQGVLSTRFAGQVRHFASVDSTNELALGAARAGWKCGVWVADEQTAGRGRGGHAWHSAPGDGLYVSALVTPSISMRNARDLAIATGLAVQAAVLESTGLELDLRWPNDLMFGDQKCAGILVESASELPAHGEKDGPEARLKYAVIGVGLNVGQRGFPAALQRIATSLYLESAREFGRETILAALLRQLDEEVRRVSEAGSGAYDGPHLYARFEAASSWARGKRVSVEEGGGYTGWTRGLDEQGFLRVEDDQGVLRTVLSGGVRSAREMKTDAARN